MPEKTILVRFRLFSDAATEGYGWVVDDLFIQEERPLGTEELESHLVVYPNPIQDVATFQLKGELSNNVSVFDLRGRQVDEIIVTPTIAYGDLKAYPQEYISSGMNWMVF